MNTKIVLLLVAVAAVGAVTTFSTLQQVMAQGQSLAQGESLAPGQGVPTNRTLKEGFPPPGQNPSGNPGQCQTTSNPFVGKEAAHDRCHS